jgi:fatty acid desaturase
MSNDKPVPPRFGPNGAVMNAATMTPELRSEYEREASLKQSILRALPFPLLLLAILGMQLIFGSAIGPIWLGVVAVLVGKGLAPLTRKHGPDR